MQLVRWGNREEGGLKRAAPTHSAHSLRPSTKEHRGTPASPTLFWICTAEAAAGERQQHEMGQAWYWLVVGVAGSQWAWRQPAAARSGALRPRSDCARFASLDPRIEPLERRCSLQWCLWGEGPGTRTGSSHLALCRAGRRAGGGDVTFHPISLADPLTVSLTISAGYTLRPWTRGTVDHLS